MSAPHKPESGGGGGGGGGELPAIISVPLEAPTEGAHEVVEKAGPGAHFALDLISGIATGAGLPVKEGVSKPSSGH